MAAASDQTPFRPTWRAGPGPRGPGRGEARDGAGDGDGDGDAPLVRFVYRSLPTVLPASVLLDIVRSAEHRNAALGASGLLTWGPSLYAQIIEGRAPDVRSLARLIGTDGRHRLLWSDLRPIPRRRIAPGLPMGYTALSDLRRPLTGTEVGDAATCARVEATLLEAVADNYPSALLAEAWAD